MDILSVIFIIILFFFVTIGIIKGFLRTLLSFSKGIISFIVAASFFKLLASFLFNLSFMDNAKSSIYNWLLNINHNFGETIMPNQTDKLYEIIKTLHIPDFVSKMIANTIATSIPNEGIIIAEQASHELLYFLLSIFSFIFLIIITRLVLMILRKIIKNMIDSLPTIRKIDRVLGVFLGLFLGVCFIDIICFALMGIINTPIFSSWSESLIEMMKLNEDTFTISKFFYNNNLLLYFFSLWF